MRLLKATLDNFGSYRHLEFTFDKPGLTLIQGSTGSGKSTLFDAPAWILYGITAKDGSVDDVRSWNDLARPTSGVLELEARGSKLTICRIRGKANENDLYWVEEGDTHVEHRGTNIKETQILLDNRLGVDSNTYLAASYYCEYSPSSTFFVSNSTQRRALFDRIANLTFPVTLAAHLSDKISESKRILLKSQADIVSLSRQLSLISGNLSDSKGRSEHWELNFTNKIGELKDGAESFEDVRAKDLERYEKLYYAEEASRITQMTSLEVQLSSLRLLQSTHNKDVCAQCGHDMNVAHLNTLLIQEAVIVAKIDKLKVQPNSHDYMIREAKSRNHSFEDQLKNHLSQVNPFKAQIAHFLQQRASIEINLAVEEQALDKLKSRTNAYEHLKDLSGELKEKLLESSIDMIQVSTNEYLTRYFDGELSVNLTLAGSNALDIIIFKNGHEAVYKQLSKGQRQLLKIAFSASVMAAVSNRSGIHFSSLFFDEALDGLDTELKVKAFSLFSSLELTHESVFVIDHAEEFKNMFSQRYMVSIEADVSTLIYEQQN